MTTCARGCCWTPHQACARTYTCKCHWLDQRPAVVKGGAEGVHKDPTAQQAIHNVMKSRGK